MGIIKGLGIIDLHKSSDKPGILKCQEPKHYKEIKHLNITIRSLRPPGTKKQEPFITDFL